MKKLFLLALAAAFVGGAAMAQEPQNAEQAPTEQAAKPEKKKGGGFFKALAKGVESTTGLNVSKEALFVYPEIAKWKMSVVSCVGDSKTCTVELKISVMALFDSPRYTGARVLITEAKVTGGKTALELQRFMADPLHDLVPNRPVEATFNRILGVPADAKTIDLKFYVNNDLPATKFELRDCPITWTTAE